MYTFIRCIQIRLILNDMYLFRDSQPSKVEKQTIYHEVLVNTTKSFQFNVGVCYLDTVNHIKVLDLTTRPKGYT